VEIGRVINDRYRLERLIKQGRICIVYQGKDKVLQRTVAIKAVPAQHAPAYRAAIRKTCHFSHPNIIGLYDLVAESEMLYIVQEYVEGVEFAALLQVSAYEVADFGCQLCQALLYASSSPHPVCHGDLTPTAVLRDRQGMVRVNNFALPGDRDYFENWSVVGGEGVVASDADLPSGPHDKLGSHDKSGSYNAGHHADDTRAVGLLLYQLLAGRPSDAMKVEPPADGQLHFPRSTPAKLCEMIARAVIRSHPHHINTIEALDSALRAVADTLEPPMPIRVSSTAQPVEVHQSRQSSPIGQARQAEVEDPRGTGKLVTALPVRETGNTGLRIAAYRADGPVNSFASDAPTTIADVSFKLAAQQAAYQELETQTRRSPILVLLLLGLVVFALFFVVGYFTGHLLFFH
jgi:serine/threonine protein kinase